MKPKAPCRCARPRCCACRASPRCRCVALIRASPAWRSAFSISPSSPAIRQPNVLTLRFAGEGNRDVRIEVECIDVLLLDLAAPRRAKSSPRHGG
ncbi:MAG: DUF2948 family protein [Asticcacaulis sp.]